MSAREALHVSARELGRAAATYAITGGSSVLALGRHALGGGRAGLDADARAWAHRLERLWSLEVSVTGLERYERDAITVLVANHQSYVDVVALVLVLPEMPVFLAKRELARVPFFSRVMRTRGDVFVDRARHDKATGAVGAAARELRRGSPLLVFPEGTRASRPEIARFKKGAFHLAKQARAALQPIGIRGSLEAWPKDSLVPRGGRVELAFGERIEVGEVQATPLDELAVRLRGEVARLSGLPLAGAQSPG